MITQPFDETSSFANTEDLLRYLRCGRVLFPNVELALVWLNIRAAGIPPPKFLPEALDLTLADLWQDTRRRFILESRIPSAVMRHYFAPLGQTLGTSVPRGLVSSGPPQKYGEYTLRQFFGPDPGSQLRDWLRHGDTLAAVALPRITAGDESFRRFWDERYSHLLYSLYGWTRESGTSPEGVTSLTWLAVHLSHETGGDWTFHKLIRIALRVFRQHPRLDREKTVILDEVDDESLAVNDALWRLHVPPPVRAAMLATLFDKKRLPHEIIAFFLCWYLGLKPLEVAKQYAACPLYDLASLIHSRFRKDADSPDQAVDALFAGFDRQLALPFRGVTSHGRRLNNNRLVLSRTVGFTSLRDFLGNGSPEVHARNISYWWGYVMKHLEDQAHTPGTPLYAAITCWLGGPLARENPLT